MTTKEPYTKEELDKIAYVRAELYKIVDDLTSSKSVPWSLEQGIDDIASMTDEEILHFAEDMGL